LKLGDTVIQNRREIGMMGAKEKNNRLAGKIVDTKLEQEMEYN
jgi:hypothetical protein